MAQQSFKIKFIPLTILFLLVSPIVIPIAFNIFTNLKFSKSLEFYTDLLIPFWVLFFSIWYIKNKVQLKSLKIVLEYGDQLKDKISRSSTGVTETIERTQLIESKQIKANKLQRELEGLEYIIAVAGIFAGILGIMKYFL